MNVQGLTIDEPWSTDLDDALWAERIGDTTVIRVTIASASSMVLAGSALDAFARERVTTKYYAKSHSPMLPRGTEQALSLLPGVRRHGLTVELIFNEKNELGPVSIFPSTLTSTARSSYAEVPAILASKGHVLHGPMALLATVSSGLVAQRRRQGAFVLYDLIAGWVASEEGHVRKLERSAEMIGHIIVQELMVAANTAVAGYAIEHGLPILFRNHQAIGSPDRASLVALLEEATTTGNSVTWLDEMRRQLGCAVHRAEYGSSPVGHFGLNLPHYCHFTSPIRRYADMITHRQVLAHVLGERLPHNVEFVTEVADHINSTLAIEREAVSNRAKEKATESAQRVLDTGVARKLESLGNKDFERAVKVMVRSGEDCSTAFAEAYLTRLRQHRLPVLVKTLVLLDLTSTGPHWTELRQSVVDYLTQHTHEATSVVTMAKDVIEGWVAPDLAEDQNGPPHMPVFKATLTREWLSVSREGRTSKEAAQRAAVAALAAISGSAPPMFPEAPTPTAPAVPKPAPVNKDPIAALGEHAQQHKRAMPVYNFDSSGPSNTPVITCTCVYEGRTTNASAGRKQDAKRAAAVQMLENL